MAAIQWTERFMLPPCRVRRWDRLRLSLSYACAGSCAECCRASPVRPRVSRADGGTGLRETSLLSAALEEGGRAGSRATRTLGARLESRRGEVQGQKLRTKEKVVGAPGVEPGTR